MLGGAKYSHEVWEQLADMFEKSRFLTLFGIDIGRYRGTSMYAHIHVQAKWSHENCSYAHWKQKHIHNWCPEEGNAEILEMLNSKNVIWILTTNQPVVYDPVAGASFLFLHAPGSLEHISCGFCQFS